MGTETILRYLERLDIFANVVKLNNPLMGTETALIKSTIARNKYPFVKLNNPLMGTETYIRCQP